MVTRTREALSIGEPEQIKRPVSGLRFNYQGFRDRFVMEAVVEAYTGDLYRQNLLTLRKTATQFDQVVFGINYEQACLEVGHNMKGRSGSMLLAQLSGSRMMEERGMEKVWSMSGRLVSSVAEMFKWESSKPAESQLIDGYIGYATALSFMAPGEEEYVKTLYISTEAILDQFRQMGLGAKFFEIANALYRPQVIAFRGRSGRMIRSLIRSGIVDAERIYPRFKRFSEDPEKASILDALASRTINPNGVDPEWGIAKGVYSEGWDRAYTPDPTHPESYKWDMWMKEEAGLDAPNGDGMFFAADVIGRPKEVSVKKYIGN